MSKRSINKHGILQVSALGSFAILAGIFFFSGDVLAAERLTASPKMGVPPLEVQFTAYIKNSEDPRSYSVDFGDGENSGVTCTRSPVSGKGNKKQCLADHTYTKPGDYTAILYKRGCPPNQKVCRAPDFVIDNVRVIVKGLR